MSVRRISDSSDQKAWAGPHHSKPDPLLCDFKMPLQGVFHPLGFPVQIATNSRDVLLAAHESWGPYPERFLEAPVQVRVGVAEGGPNVCPPTPVVRGQRNLVTLVSDMSNFAVCDMKQGFGYCWVTPAAVENRPFFRYYFLEGMVYVMLQSLHLTPIHAACVARGGKGVLLCGGPRAGKSSLAFACARRGWTFISDDASYLVRSRNDNVVVGNPHVMRFQESAIELFPELKGHPVPPRVNGEVKIELATANQPGMATAPQASVDYVLFLDRQDSGLPCILPFPKEEALRWLEQVVCYGEKQVRDAQAASLVNLLTAEVFELRYSDLDLAVDLISSLVGDTV